MLHFGINNDLIDRLYRCLFVYSLGLFNVMKRAIKHCNKKHLLISRLWKVYIILLEYCSISDYQMMIAQVNKVHHEEVDQLNEKLIQ